MRIDYSNIIEVKHYSRSEQAVVNEDSLSTNESLEPITSNEALGGIDLSLLTDVSTLAGLSPQKREEVMEYIRNGVADNDEASMRAFDLISEHIELFTKKQ